MKPLVAVAFCLWSSASFGTEYLDSAKHFLPVCKEAMIYKPKPTATIEARPQLLEKNFTGLAIDALRDAWPCKK